QYCEPARPCTYVIGPGNHRRWEISLLPGEDPAYMATEEGAWSVLQRWIGPEDATLWRQASYRFPALVAREWRRGRVVIAGDAAGGAIKTVPRQDIIPPLAGGLLAPGGASGTGTLFPQPRVNGPTGPALLDELAGTGWRIVTSLRIDQLPPGLPPLVETLGML